MDRIPEIRLFVLDTGPLITLAAADALDYLTYPAAPIFIPDAVFYEATNKQGSLGQQAILDWAQERADLLHIVPTSVYADLQILLTSGQRPRDRGLGERAAFEVLELSFPLEPHYAVLLVEDSGVINSVLASPRMSQVLPVTTTDFLVLLETEGRINSAEAVLGAAEDAGRHASRERALNEAHERGLNAVRTVLRRQDREL